MAKQLLLGIGAIALVVAVALSVSSSESPRLVGVSEVIAESPTFVYETFSQERYQALKGSEAFAVFFHSASCGTCAKKHQSIIDTVGTFSGGAILKQEFSEASVELLSELGVTTYDTFVIFNADGSFETVTGATIAEVREAIGTEQETEQEEDLSLKTEQAAQAHVIANTEVFSYESFTDERFAALRGTEAFGIFFHSETCGTCAKKHQQILNELAQFEGGVLLKQEYAQASTDLLQELGVTSYDTFVVFDETGTFRTILGATVEEVRASIE